MTDLRLRVLLDPPDNADRSWFQQRGRNFENVLRHMLSREKMEPRTSMRPDGEEIDGSFMIGDSSFLLEAKWHAKPIPASALYAFKGKVDGKLVGTIGTFFSMSDYSTEAIDALLAGKELNLILFGRNDLLLIEDEKITLREAMRVKLRYAANYGQPFFDLETHLAEQAKQDQITTILKPQQEWIILVEGEDDVRTIEELLMRFEIAAKTSISPAGGQLSVAPLAQYLQRIGNKNVAAIVTPISDSTLQQKQLQELDQSGVELIILREPLEDWLGNYVSFDYYNATVSLSNRGGKMARRYARHADLDKLLTENQSFSLLMNKLEARQKS
ncbi:restriction endonuclease [Advenella kashmirensis W13003]|uniref:Restriction endonuclease n=1 Tax=Advenella kashmirensis W13003 TaxID=1424334 RepID=V8QMM0_9BURK|nr:restriction endonuclease [Advenella kashmirensis]ETF00530.1 restriction endonuclease [Advenella kashmirensis W13003]